jgi:hypothetical protein
MNQMRTYRSVIEERKKRAESKDGNEKGLGVKTNMVWKKKKRMSEVVRELTVDKKRMERALDVSAKNGDVMFKDHSLTSKWRVLNVMQQVWSMRLLWGKMFSLNG